MIFVAVGTQRFKFDRLLRQVDSLVENGFLQDDIFAQTGSSSYKPKFYKSKEFLNKSEFDSKISTCDLLITHCGVGTIITGLKKEKPVIVCPRLAKYKEHVDDHQLEIAEAFSKLNYVLVCSEGDDLLELP